MAGSGCAACVFRSLKISAVAYGEDDQMMRTRGKVSVRRTSLDWIDWEAVVAVSARGSCFFFDAYLDGLAYDFVSATAWSGYVCQ